VEREVVIAYLDTNVVIRLEAGLRDQISAAAERIIENASQLLISPIVLLELEMLYELARLKYGANQIFANLSQRIGVQICQLPMALTVASSLDVKWTREPGDRLIVANAIANRKSPLVTSDRKILENYPEAVW
jgi:PIN domain nuclease of toxin-antitoxin system